MNDTRKQIIELIEPYMDKSLGIGCIVLFEQHIQGMISPYKPKYITIGSEHGLPNGRTVEILGHYDITALLKLINSNTGDFSKQYHLGTDYQSEEFGLLLMENEWGGKVEVNGSIYYQVDFIKELPNKPLHLYTEQEDKDLLKLLLQLCKN